VAESLAGFGSWTSDETCALLTIDPDVVAVTMIVTTAVDKGPMSPRKQVTKGGPPQTPWLGVAETNETPGGRGSESFTLRATTGPAFVTMSA
jgi:hypothetical protein